VGRRAHTQRLNIWLNGTPVGYWDARPGQHSLTYFEEWLSDEDSRPLSLSLPFKPNNEPYRGALVQNYFDNLLPDSVSIRRRIAQHFKTDGIEPYQLLAAVGRDCVGAIQLLPEDESPSDLFRIDGSPLNEAQVAALLRNAVSVRPRSFRSSLIDCWCSREKCTLMASKSVAKTGGKHTHYSYP